MSALMWACLITIVVVSFIIGVCAAVYSMDEVRDYIRRKNLTNAYWPDSARVMEIRLRTQIAGLEKLLMQAAADRFEAMQDIEREQKMPVYLELPDNVIELPNLLRREAE